MSAAEGLTEERVRNYLAWCAARVGSLSGADIGVALADAWLASRSPPPAPASGGELPFKLPFTIDKTGLLRDATDLPLAKILNANLDVPLLAALNSSAKEGK